MKKPLVIWMAKKRGELYIYYVSSTNRENVWSSLITGHFGYLGTAKEYKEHKLELKMSGFSVVKVKIEEVNRLNLI